MKRIALTVLKRTAFFANNVLSNETLSAEDKVVVLIDYFADIKQMITELEESAS